MGLRTSKEAKIRLNHQLNLIMSPCDGAGTQLDAGCQNHKTSPGAGVGALLEVACGTTLKETKVARLARWLQGQVVWLVDNRMTAYITAILVPFMKIG